MTQLSDIIAKLQDLLGAILPLLIGIAVIIFVWGVVIYFIGDSEEAKKKGRDRIIYGIIGLAVIVSLWGLVTIVAVTLGVNGKAAPSEEISGLVATSTSSSECPIGTKFQGIIDYATCIIGRSIIPFIFALAVLMFIWGAVKFFIIGADEETKRNEGKQFMLWGIIALVVMVSVWGLVKIVGTTFNLDTSALPQVRP